MSRFLCVGDLHLDKGGRYGRAPGERLAEQETVWARCLELAREHNVDAVLFAGDAFEKRHPSTDAMLAFERPLVEHREAEGPSVIAIPGNHDRSGVSDFCALDVFAEADLIWLYSRPVWTPTVMGTAIAFLPWAPVSRIVAADGGGDRDDINQVAAELLLETARGLRSQIEGPAILLTHFSISGAVTPDGADVGLFREPVLNLGDIEALGFDAVIAGHIHKPQLLFASADDAQVAFYVGSPMPLDFGEAKCAHGVYLLEVDDAGTQSSEFLPIESRPFVTLDGRVDDDTFHPWEEVAEAFVKIRLSGTEEEMRHYDLAGLRAALLDGGGARNVWVELQVERELRARVAGMDETVSDVEALTLWLESQSVNGAQAPALHSLHGDYLQEIS